MRPRPDPAQQAVTGLIVAVVIIVTLMCGVALALSERGTDASSLTPLPTVYLIPTLPEGSATHIPTLAVPSASAPTVIVIPTSVPATRGGSPNAQSGTTTTATATQTAPSAPCLIAANWQPYRIQSGDTLFLIGLRYGLTVDAIMRGNCLSDSRIQAGGSLYVPPVTPIPLETWQAGLTTTPNSNTATLEPGPTATHTGTDGACTVSNSVILSPKVGQVISGTISITGTARLANFQYYKIEIRQEGSAVNYANLFTGKQEISNAPLATLDTTIWANGEYWLRLMVVDQDNAFPEPCAILVTFRN